ncbi:putative cyclin [Helianthus annuus]|nr:putative cyclin [Helianthus annuus]KAJ0912818.1 putative cyclin [Helianthus annuus]
MMVCETCRELKTKPQTCVTAAQYFDIFLSKAAEILLEDPNYIKLWAVVCVRMAFKVVERRDLHLSQWAAHLSTEEDLNKCEIDLSETLKWKFCLPTVYTFFHYLKQSMKLEFLNDGMAQDGAVADSIIIHSLVA